MHFGAKLFIEALGLFWENRWAALRIAAVPVVFLLVFDLMWWSYPENDWLIWGNFAAWTIFIAWIAIAWHRHLLLENAVMPSTFKRLGLALIYGVLVIIFLLTGLLPFIGGLAFWDSSTLFEMSESHQVFVFSIVLVIGLVLGIYVLFRFGLVLPHLALDRGWLGFVQSWQRTSGLGLGLWIYAALLAGLFALPLPLEFTFEEAFETAPGLLLASCFSAFIAIIDITLLTRLYDYAMTRVAPKEGEAT